MAQNRESQRAQELVKELIPLPGMPYDFDDPIEQQQPFYIYQLPRVVFFQNRIFANDELFQSLACDNAFVYSSYLDLELHERQILFQNGCRAGHTEISFANSGTDLQLTFKMNQRSYLRTERCDFEQEPGKVHIRSHFIMKGICVRFIGWVDLHRLDGIGHLEYDRLRGMHEDAILRANVDRYNKRMNEFEEVKRAFHGMEEPFSSGAFPPSMRMRPMEEPCSSSALPASMRLLIKEEPCSSSALPASMRMRTGI